MSSTSKVDSSSSVPAIFSSARGLTPRLISVSTRNVGVPVWNQWAANSRLSNSSRMSKGL